MPGNDHVDPCHQFLGAEGLDHVVVDPQLEAEELVVLLTSGAEHDGGDILYLFDLFAGGEAVKLGHHDVHDDEIVVVELAEPEGYHAVLGFFHLVSGEFSIFSDDLADLGFVIYYKKFVHYIFSSFGDICIVTDILSH